jgi:hypothetical protein
MSGVMQRAAAGSLAGLAATAPMTAVMKALHPELPPQHREPLPPRQIAMNAAEAVGVKDELSEPERRQLTMAGHYAYGAGVGAVYGLLAPNLPLPPALSGVGFALGVWAASYLGWLPAAGLYRSATEEPAERNALMLAAHVVYGGALGLLAGALLDGRAQGRRR